jgi:multicomponent Na+:H+ antiporter subunit D
MTAIGVHLPILVVLVPLIGALLAALCRRGWQGLSIAAIACLADTVAGVWMLLQVRQTGAPISYVMGGWAAPWGIEYRVDVLNAFVIVIVAAIGAIAMPFAGSSVAREIDDDRQAWFYCMFLTCLAGLVGIAVTGDAFNIFVFLEISSLATYVLIAMGRDRRALLAAYQYLVVGTIGATFYVIGIGLLYLATGTLNLVDMASRLVPVVNEDARPVLAALAFVTVGISLKLALFPLHGWLPNAYAYAPSVATAFLAGTATKVAIYLLLRFFFGVLDPSLDFVSPPVDDILMVASVAAMFLASLSAVFEGNARRMLAYSSVGQVGYITLGIAIANQDALTGAIVHLFNHAVMKAALFLAMGAIFYRIGSVKISDLAGIGRKMPFTTTAFVIAGLGIIGVPGTAGFISKWYLALGALESGNWLLVFLIVASSAIAVAYIGRVVEAAWLREPSELAARATEAPLAMLVPIWVLALATLYFGIDTRASADIAAEAARMLLRVAQ